MPETPWSRLESPFSSVGVSLSLLFSSDSNFSETHLTVAFYLTVLWLMDDNLLLSFRWFSKLDQVVLLYCDILYRKRCIFQVKSFERRFESFSAFLQLSTNHTSSLCISFGSVYHSLYL